jgi:HKD family nuclease
MRVRIIGQPESQLGITIRDLLESGPAYRRIIFVSAFVALRTILRLRDALLNQVERGALLRIVAGIDLGGTSREVLEELLSWKCEALVFHNTIPRSTFHPKLCLFEAQRKATLFVGSNNLTEGGFYTNYELTTRFDFELPTDAPAYREASKSLKAFVDPKGITVRRLSTSLIQTLVHRGDLPSEEEARQRRREQALGRKRGNDSVSPSPFAAVTIPSAPLLPQNLRGEEKARRSTKSRVKRSRRTIFQNRSSVLVWKKYLTKSDASNVKPGTQPKAVVVLTQADFKDTSGKLIDQTTYFRNLFLDFEWEPEAGKHPDQEHAFVPMRTLIKGRDYGVRNFEISHKPSGEAKQRNSPTSLRWGRDFNPIVRNLRLTGAVFELYETPDESTPFLIRIR